MGELLNILIVKPVVDGLIADAEMLPMSGDADVELSEHTTVGVLDIAGENVMVLSTYEPAATDVEPIVPARMFPSEAAVIVPLDVTFPSEST